MLILIFLVFRIHNSTMFLPYVRFGIVFHRLIVVSYFNFSIETTDAVAVNSKKE